MAKAIATRLDRLQFASVLKRSLILERLLGGCLTFLGIEDDEDEPAKPYHPKKTKARLAFCNSIPISRISRVTWDTDPLSEGYMRPEMFLVNGQEVHTSRCLVWDGEPLFDPYDFALTNFRSNLAGFGPSKLAPIWDDIVKAVGTRQAAYQLIKTNNAILMAVNDLQSLAGTASGKQALAKLKEIANNISVYNAALIDGEKVEVQQNAASFGSVPELILTFIQILSAASDIPATRFLGQAPGGLNATGDSDLENYYNVIDAYQRQRIEPQLRRIYDVIGYSINAERWHKERNDLEFNFPPLWNESELEEAQKNSQVIDNVLKLLENNLITEEKAIQEINAKGALSVMLDEDDLGVLDAAEGAVDEAEEGATQDARSSLMALKNAFQVPAKAPAGEADLLKMVRRVGDDPDRYDINELRKGFKEEQEHADTVGGDELEVLRITLDHLREDPKYYTKLARAMNAKERTVDVVPKTFPAKGAVQKI
jgi:phage-related protein (TIGR01555 family)